MIRVGNRYFLKTYSADGTLEPMRKWKVVTAVPFANKHGLALVDEKNVQWNEWLDNKKDMVPFEDVVR